MNQLQSKFREVTASLTPVIIFVIFCVLVLVPVEQDVILRFLIGSVLLFLGLAFFLWGIDQSMTPIGNLMARHMAHSRNKWSIFLFAFLIGFLIDIAEPDLLILGHQIEAVSGGALSAQFLVNVVSLGVGIMVGLGSLRTLSSFPLNRMMAIVYGIICFLAIFASKEYLAIGFDASGATTGALTTPFVLAISYSLSQIKGGENADADSFGMVGAMSSGPIWACLLLSILTGQNELQGDLPQAEAVEGVLRPVLHAFPATFKESFIALAPIIILFLIMNAVEFKTPKEDMIGIVRGLIYTLLGLTFFLVGANEGFMEMGSLLGQGLASGNRALMIVLGFVLGFFVVSAEPAVLVLGEQVETVTAGHIPASIIGMTLSIGNGLAIALSLARITSTNLELWHFLLPGFALAILLSFYVDKIFVGIAFDAGGVASGPMAATFILAFAQGVAAVWPTADVLKDGFGIIAMIAMMPVLSIMILGAIFQAKRTKAEKELDSPQQAFVSPVQALPAGSENYQLLTVTVEHDMGHRLIEKVQSLGASGATLVSGRDERGRQWSKYALNLDPARDMLWIVVPADQCTAIVEALQASAPQDAHMRLFSVQADDTVGLVPAEEAREVPAAEVSDK